MAPHSSTLAWKLPWMEEPGRLQSMGSLSWTRLSDFTFTFHFHALEKEMATHSSILAWRIPGMGKPGGLLSMGLHRVGHNWSDLAAAAKGLLGEQAPNPGWYKAKTLTTSGSYALDQNVKSARCLYRVLFLSLVGLNWTIFPKSSSPLHLPEPLTR